MNNDLFFEIIVFLPFFFTIIGTLHEKRGKWDVAIVIMATLMVFLLPAGTYVTDRLRIYDYRIDRYFFAAEFIFAVASFILLYLNGREKADEELLCQ